MSPRDQRLHAALNDALEVVAVADTAKGLGGIALTDVLAAPEPIRARLLEILRQCWVLNAEIMAAGQRISSQLDGLARAQHGPSSIKGLARTLRPALRVLGDPHAHTAAEYVSAVRTVDDLALCVPRERLLSGSMRHELRSRAFRTLAAHLPLPRPVGVGGRAATIGSSSHLEAVA